MLADLVSGHKAVARTALTAFAPAETAGDQSTADLLTRRLQIHEKTARMLRSMLDEWAYVRPYQSETERTAALADWLHTYNHHRNHTPSPAHPSAE